MRNPKGGVDDRVIKSVERAIIESKIYETKKQLWARLRGQMDHDSFERAILELHKDGKIKLDRRFLIYTGVSNPELKELVASSSPF